MDKKRLLQEIISELREVAKTSLAAAQATRDEATHEDNKAESKYDTRGLEASYLAEGQARLAEEAESNLAKFEALSLRDYAPGDVIALGALVGLEMERFRDLYFCGPGAGGMEIELDGTECTIITRDSPMGAQLYGSKLGQTFRLNDREATIVSLA